MADKTTVLMVLDGYGISDNPDGNAIAAANKPNIDSLMSDWPWELGYASGLDVGLPDGQMGNSEVGHLNIGAGRIVYQDLTRITKSICDGDFFENEALLGAIGNCKEHGSSLHLYGLLSDGGVHSHNTHLYALLKLARQNGLEKVFIHAFLDGRDTPPASGMKYIAELEAKLTEIGVGKIATVSGRYYAMDRDKHYDRVKIAYDAMVLGEGETAASAGEGVAASYGKGPTYYDEFVVPFVIYENGKPVATIRENDSIIFFNFRPDRAREITRAFCDADFDRFERPFGYFKNYYACFTNYDATIENKHVAFSNDRLAETMGEYISSLGLRQFRLAETEKYAHVTFFFNGGVEKEYPGEERRLIPSPRVATYDMKPEMSAAEVCDELVKRIASGAYDLIIVNFANPDMVGHTGIMEAAVRAIETVDACVGRAVRAVTDAGAQMFLCADHGNSDQMVDYDTNEPFTAHTTNPVPFIVVNCDKARGIDKNGKLCDISPTLLDMMGLPQPAEMTGRSLLIK